MKTNLIFNTSELTNNLKSSTEFYEINEKGKNLFIVKKYINKRGRPFSLNIPREIILTSKALGLIVGEGFVGDRNFIFANSNENAIKEVLDFLKQFNLPIKMYLEISMKNKFKSFEKYCQKFWENNLGVNLNKIRLRKEFNNITRHGTIHLTLNNSLIARLLKQIINTSKRKVEKNKKLSIDYLKGIIAAEGNVNAKTTTTNCLYMVRISASKKEEREHYKRCLKRVGITIYCEDMETISAEEGIRRGWKTSKGRAGAVIISRWENFVKLFENGLLNLNTDKKTKFLQYFTNNKFTKQFLEFEYFLGKEFTMKDAQTYFKFKGRHLDRVLTLCKQGYISRRKINKRDYIYKLTNNYVKLYNQLKKELKLNITPLL